MTLLIADDERRMINHLRGLLDWSELGFDRILCANDGLEALHIFETERIDILLCDVEMPGMDGLQLATYIEKQQLSTQVIIISAHASFSYAQKALRTGSVDYLLKPVNAEQLKGVITNVLQKINTKQSDNENPAVQNWKTYEPLVLEHFWYNAVRRGTETNCKELLMLAEERNILLNEQQQYLLIVIDLKKNKSSAQFVDADMEFEIRKDIQRAMAEFNSVWISIERNKISGILYASTTSFYLVRQVKEQMNTLLCTLSETYGCTLRCCLSNFVLFSKITETFQQLNHQLYEDIVSKNCVITSANYSTAYDAACEQSILDTLSRSIEQNQPIDAIMTQIRNHLVYLQMHHELTRNRLTYFQSCLEQLFSIYMRQNELNAQLLLEKQEIYSLRVNSSESADGLLQWAYAALDQIIKCVEETRKGGAVIESVKQYVKQNLGMPLHRKEIAAQVYLNPDYLDRVFKKYTGMSVSNYIGQMRIQKAKELLLNTELSVSDIALRVGYPNVSNFTSFFKRTCGVNPKKFRQRANRS